MANDSYDGQRVTSATFLFEVDGVEIGRFMEVRGLEVGRTPHNETYLRTKARAMGHLLPGLDPTPEDPR